MIGRRSSGRRLSQRRKSSSPPSPLSQVSTSPISRSRILQPLSTNAYKVNSIVNKVASARGKENITSTRRRSPSVKGLNGNKKLTIAIEGNIGCGKTTLLNYLSQSEDVQVLTEPVDEWKDCRGHNLLGLMYNDPGKYAFTFQSYVQLSMLNVHKLPHSKPVKLLERSLFSARYCFVENMHVTKRIEDAEYVVLDEWFKWLVNYATIQLDHIVYLRSSPEVCHQRILQRCRKEETGIPLSYLTEIHDRHEEWLIKKSKFSLPAPVIVLDANLDLPEMLKQFEDQRKELLKCTL